MRFIQKLITPVIATVLLLGGAAFAQGAVMDTIQQSDGSWQDAGLFHWRYDASTGELEWGDGDCTTPTTEVSADGEFDHFDSNCHTIDLTEPRGPAAGEDDEEPVGSDTELNHGDVVSRVAHDVKEADDNGELGDANRGSIISRIAKETQDLFKGDDADEPEDEATEDDVDDASTDNGTGPPEHAGNDKTDEDKTDEDKGPAKAKGKGK